MMLWGEMVLRNDNPPDETKNRMTGGIDQGFKG